MIAEIKNWFDLATLVCLLTFVAVVLWLWLKATNDIFK